MRRRTVDNMIAGEKSTICGLAQSGTCTMYIDRKAVQSCVIRVSASAREGLDAPGPCAALMYSPRSVRLVRPGGGAGALITCEAG